MGAPLGPSPDGTKIAFLSYADQGKVSILALADSSIVKHSAVCPAAMEVLAFVLGRRMALRF